VPTMKRFRLRLSSIMWLVVIAAAFLAGIRYGEFRATARRGNRRVVRTMVLSTPETADVKVQVHRGE
jgi:hypothetical protein